jgi:hypothetical protein
VVIALSLVDAFVGIWLLVAAVLLALRRSLGLHLLRTWWLPLAAYEIGRWFGLATAQPADMDAYKVATACALVACFVGVWKAMSSNSLEQHIQANR